MSDGGSPSLRSEGSSAPPPAAPAKNSASQLAAAHPLWQRAAGRGASVPRGGAGGRGGGSNKDAARFEPLSAMMIEFGGFRANADGDSALFSEAESVARGPTARKGRVCEDENEEEGAFSAMASSEEGDSEEEGKCQRKKKKKSRSEAPANADAAMYAQAAFGGGYAASDDEESVSQMSGTSSTRRKNAYKACFPIKGIDCVGCMLVKQIAPVERFVKNHFEKMSEDALWKQAALVYVREVQEPRKKEGVLTPGVRANCPLNRTHTHTHTRYLRLTFPLLFCSGRGRTCAPTTCCIARTTPSRAPLRAVSCRPCATPLSSA